VRVLDVDDVRVMFRVHVPIRQACNLCVFVLVVHVPIRSHPCVSMFPSVRLGNMDTPIRQACSLCVFVLVALLEDDDDCFYYHFWRNNVVIAFGTLSSSRLKSGCLLLLVPVVWFVTLLAPRLASRRVVAAPRCCVASCAGIGIVSRGLVKPVFPSYLSYRSAS